MPHVREGINCVLRYALAQPVEMDVMVTISLISEYTGLSLLLASSTNEKRANADTAGEILLADYGA